ncbi:MAG TPA: hypothetical protein VGR35_17115 [Tepidisphaeraceae bacterium]|nr:hypothetical protein [Tepidisphaeraceae bacterium]
MLRRLLKLSAALSLIVLLAICAIWVRSFYWTDQKTLTPDAVYEVMSSSGSVVFYRLEPADGEVRWMRPAITRSFLSAEVIEGRLARRRPWIMLLLPYWLPAAVATVLPALWLVARANRERKSRVPRCPVCGSEFQSPADTCPVCPASAPAALASDPRASAPAPAAPALPALNPKPVAYRRVV